jgi:methionyl-tRNA formyltransferase
MVGMLRVVSLNMFLPGYRLVADWADRNGHEIVLVVTLPSSAGHRYDEAANPLVVDLPEATNVLVTGKLRKIAAPVIESLQPDLVISAAFPRLIPAEVLGIAKYGALNCHPSRLPAGRGPNPARLVYEGADEIAATVHRTEAEFDTGAILAQRSRPLPEDLTGPALLESWREMLGECLDEAVPRAVAGDPGLRQDPALATDASFFTTEEQLLDLTEPAAVLRRKTAALNATAPQARIHLAGADHVVSRTDVVPDQAPDLDGQAEPGTILATHDDGWTVRAGDLPVRLTLAGPRSYR